MTLSFGARLNRIGARLGLVAPKMYDSVSVGALPPGAYAYAGYVDGIYATWNALVARFGKSGAHLLSITVNGADWAMAHSIDDEPGDATNATAVQFVLARLRLKSVPIVYTSASNLATLEADLSRAGVARTRYLLWSAHYTGSPHFCAVHTCGYGTSTPADATQYASSQYNPIGGNKDISVVSKAFFGVLPPPAPKPPVPKPVDFRGPSKVKDGYYWWEVVDYGKSLSTFAAGRNTTAEALIAHTLSADSPIDGVNKANFENYAKWNPKGNGTMPRGLVYYTYNS